MGKQNNAIATLFDLLDLCSSDTNGPVSFDNSPASRQFSKCVVNDDLYRYGATKNLWSQSTTDEQLLKFTDIRKIPFYTTEQPLNTKVLMLKNGTTLETNGRIMAKSLSLANNYLLPIDQNSENILITSDNDYYTGEFNVNDDYVIKINVNVNIYEQTYNKYILIIVSPFIDVYNQDYIRYQRVTLDSYKTNNSQCQSCSVKPIILSRNSSERLTFDLSNSDINPYNVINYLCLSSDTEIIQYNSNNQNSNNKTGPLLGFIVNIRGHAQHTTQDQFDNYILCGLKFDITPNNQLNTSNIIKTDTKYYTFHITTVADVYPFGDKPDCDCGGDDDCKPDCDNDECEHCDMCDQCDFCDQCPWD